MLPMMGEPRKTAYDMYFQCARIPVRISPWFWAISLFLGINHGGIELLMFPPIVFVSILIHELGHAVVMRRFGETPRIVLYAMGGLAISDGPSYGRQPEPRTARNQILISLAGPGAGFLFAAILIGAVYALGGRIESAIALTPDLSGLIDDSQSNEKAIGFLKSAVRFLLFINIYWGIMNLMPVYPLDGGQVARELLTLGDPWKGVIRSLWLSIVTSVLLAVAGLLLNLFILMIMFGLMAFSNYQTLQAFTGRGGGMGGGGGGYRGGGGGYDDGYGDRNDRPW